jgi:vacuolar-type H+-ATPase subunit H
MSALSDLLERLRRLRPPPGGPATVVAVPSPGESVAREVTFLFDALDEVETQARDVRESAQAEAAAIEARGRAERSRILEEARQQAERAAAQLLARRHAACEREAAAILADARRAATQVLARGRASTPALVDDVVRRITEQAC